LIFEALQECGDHWKIAPASSCMTQRKYAKTSNVLQTTFGASTIGFPAPISFFGPAVFGAILSLLYHAH